LNIHRETSQNNVKTNETAGFEITYLLVADEAVILLPEGQATVGPADSEGMDRWVPFHLSDLVLATGDLEVRHEGALVGHKDDAGRVGGDGEHHVDLTVGPGRQQALLVVLHGDEVIKEHSHGSIWVFLQEDT